MPVKLKAEDFKGKIDFGIITIREDEYTSVLKRLPAKAHIYGRRIYSYAECQSQKGETYRIVIVRCISQGNLVAQDVTRDLIEDLDPNWLMVVGIAGGIPSDDFTLGDVVLATSLLNFSIEAVSGMSGHKHTFAASGGPMSREVENFLAAIKSIDKEFGEWNSPSSIGVSSPSPSGDLYGPKDWQEKITESLKRHFSGLSGKRIPNYTTGPIVSSDKLIKEPELVKQWQETARHLYAVEMELAGIYTASRRDNRQYPILAVRGISDIMGLKRTDDWTKFACNTAASLAYEIIRWGPIEPRNPVSKNTPPMSLLSKTEGSTEESEEYLIYKRLFEKRLKKYCEDVIRKDNFNFVISDYDLKSLLEKINEFNVTYTLEKKTQQSLVALIDLVRVNYKVFLNGVAGGGKTITLIGCATHLLTTEGLPSVVIELSRRGDIYSELKTAHELNVSIEEQFDILLKASIADINQATLSKFPGEKFIMIDGLNEVFGQDQRRLILKVIQEYLRQKTSNLRILITERKTEITADLESWEIAQVELLDPRYVKEQYINRYGEQEFNKLSDKVLELLRIPFFLTFALEDDIKKIASASGAIFSYFINRVLKRVEVSTERIIDLEGKLKELSQAAYKAYELNKSRSFYQSDFSKTVGEETWVKLEEAGAVDNLGAGYARFSHHLLHDFLATHYLSLNKILWQSQSFDVVSFDTNSLMMDSNIESLDPISMTMEQIDVSSVDDFLKSTYDWNWVATVTSLAKIRHADKQSLSPKVEIVMLAITAEKKFDRVLRTRERAERNFKLFPNEVVKEFRESANLLEIQSIVKRKASSVNSSSDWFDKWVNIFTRSNNTKLSEDDLELIVSKDSIIGWTMSNVCRRSRLSEGDCVQLRSYYNLLEQNSKSVDHYAKIDDWPYAVQWRLVHALGLHPSEKNAEILFSALRNAKFIWLEYGAARALIEMAALANRDLRTRLIERLMNELEGLHQATLEEICQTAIFYEAPQDWVNLINPLMQKILDLQKESEEKVSIERIIERFQVSYKKIN